MAGAWLAALVHPARTDAITDWNQRSAQIITEARIGTPPAVRVMALVQTGAYEAARDAARDAQADPQAVDAAIAAAHRTAFSRLLPAQRAAIDAAFQAAATTMMDDALRAKCVGDRPRQHPAPPASGH